MKVEGNTSLHTCDRCNAKIDFEDVKVIKSISYERDPKYKCNSYKMQQTKLLELCKSCYTKMFSNVTTGVDYSISKGGCRIDDARNIV